MATATERTLTVQLPNGAQYVDVSAVLGRANQRLYRQGMVYSMSVSYQGNWPVGAPNQIEVAHLPNNWAIRRAHQVARKAWMDSTKEERAAGIKAGRWNDFRVFFDNTHTGANNVNTPFGSAGLGTGEILFTDAEKADGSGALEFHFIGPGSATRFGMLAQYDALADTDVDTPSAGASVMPYQELSNDLVNTQANQLQEEGDNPPYDPEVMQNNIVLPSYVLGHPTVSNRHTTPIMHVPAGLLGFVNRGDTQLINITLKAGSYKGVAAEVI
jgi:hypothetical protein